MRACGALGRFSFEVRTILPGGAEHRDRLELLFSIRPCRVVHAWPAEGGRH